MTAGFLKPSALAYSLLPLAAFRILIALVAALGNDHPELVHVGGLWRAALPAMNRRRRNRFLRGRLGARAQPLQRASHARGELVVVGRVGEDLAAAVAIV